MRNRYESLKEKSLKKINEKNAEVILETSKRRLLSKLISLNVNNATETEVEDLYLIAAQLIRAASLLNVDLKDIFEQEQTHKNFFKFPKLIIDTTKPYYTTHLEMLGVASRLGYEHANVNELKRDSFSISKDFELKPVSLASDLESDSPFAENSAMNQYILRLEELYTFFSENRGPFENQKKQLFKQGQVIYKQIKTIGESQEHLSSDDLEYLGKVLYCVKNTCSDCNNKGKSIRHAGELATLSLHASGKANINWQALGLGLLVLGCATLVTIGVLAAIPTGGTSLLASLGGASLLFTLIESFSLTAAIGGASLFYFNREKGLAKSVSQFKKTLDEFKNDNNENEDLDSYRRLSD